MAGAAEVVVDLGSQVLQLAAELNAVTSLHPVRPVVHLEPVAREPRLEVVTHTEIPAGTDRRDRSHSRQVREPHAEVLYVGHLWMGLPGRVETVVGEHRLIQ